MHNFFALLGGNGLVTKCFAVRYLVIRGGGWKTMTTLHYIQGMTPGCNIQHICNSTQPLSFQNHLFTWFKLMGGLHFVFKHHTIALLCFFYNQVRVCTTNDRPVLSSLCIYMATFKWMNPIPYNFFAHNTLGFLGSYTVLFLDKQLPQIVLSVKNCINATARTVRK